MGGDPGEVHAAAVMLDHDQDVEAVQEDGVDVGEVDGEDRVRLRGQELSLGRSGPLGCGIDSGDLQDLPHRRGGDLVAESDQLALDASIPHRGFSRAIRSTSARIGWATGGRPGFCRG